MNNRFLYLTVIVSMLLLTAHRSNAANGVNDLKQRRDELIGYIAEEDRNSIPKGDSSCCRGEYGETCCYMPLYKNPARVAKLKAELADINVKLYGKANP